MQIFWRGSLKAASAATLVVCLAACGAASGGNGAKSTAGSKTHAPSTPAKSAQSGGSGAAAQAPGLIPVPKGALAFFPPTGQPGSGLVQTQDNPVGSTGDSEFVIQPVAGTLSFVFQQNTASAGAPISYLYWYVNASESQFLSAHTLYLTIRYYDQPAKGSISADYDSSIAGAPVNGAYENTGSVTLGGTAAWKTQTWTLKDASFQGKENGGADFRLDGTVGVAVSEVILSLNAPKSS